MVATVAVEGLKALNRSLRKAQKGGLVKAVGRANKKVGRKAAGRWLYPKPRPQTVGAGRGADVRPSAAKRELKLRVGGAHRAGHVPQMQWGKRPVREPGERAGDRPYIKKSILDHRDELFRMWIDEIDREMRAAGGVSQSR